MAHVTSPMPQGPSAHQAAIPPVFSASVEDDVVRRWGAVFSTFGYELDSVLDAMLQVGLGGADLAEQMHAASRRYGYLLEAMCASSGRAQRPCSIYDCCDGVTVLLLQQGEGVESPAFEAYEAERTTLDEKVFTSALSKAILAYFDSHTKVRTQLVTVSVGSGEFVFMRAAHRDEVLQKLHISTNAEVY